MNKLRNEAAGYLTGRDVSDDARCIIMTLAFVGEAIQDELRALRKEVATMHDKIPEKMP